MSGKRGTAPCGHEGEHVVGNYVQCLSGCDEVKPKEPAAKAKKDAIEERMHQWQRDYLSKPFPTKPTLPPRPPGLPTPTFAKVRTCRNCQGIAFKQHPSPWGPYYSCDKCGKINMDP